MRLAVLLALSLGAAEGAETGFTLARGFSARIPDHWVVRESWSGPAPAVDFSEVGADGLFRILVSKYPKANPWRMTQKKFVSELEQRTPKEGRVKAEVEKKKYALYRGLPVQASSWQAAHFDPDEGVLGGTGGDFSAENRLKRCREKGAWRKYAWYRDAYKKPGSMELFFKYFTDQDREVIRLCLGSDALRTIEGHERPDPAIMEPNQGAPSPQVAPGPLPPGEETIFVREAHDGFYVIHYETPAGKQDKRYPVFLRFISTFKPLP